MNKFVKMEYNRDGLKLMYKFALMQVGNAWKTKAMLDAMSMGFFLPPQGYMTDFEYFMLIEKKKLNMFAILQETFYLVVDDIPVSSIIIMYTGDKKADISFETLKEYRHQGYATMALNLAEEYLFQKEDIFFTTMTDISDNGYTTQIALKNGYIPIDNQGHFVKNNPNISLEQIQEDIPRKV